MADSYRFEVGDKQGRITVYCNGQQVMSWDSYRLQVEPFRAVWWKPWTWKHAKAWLENGVRVEWWFSPNAETLQDLSIRSP